MFERFTEEAIKVIMLSQEARRLGHNFVVQSRSFVWLQKEPHRGKVLKSLGVNLIEAREEVEIIGRGSGFIGVEILSPLAASAFLSYAWKKRAFGARLHWHRTLLEPDPGWARCKSIRKPGS